MSQKALSKCLDNYERMLIFGLMGNANRMAASIYVDLIQGMQAFEDKDFPSAQGFLQSALPRLRSDKMFKPWFLQSVCRKIPQLICGEIQLAPADFDTFAECIGQERLFIQKGRQRALLERACECYSRAVEYIDEFPAHIVDQEVANTIDTEYQEITFLCDVDPAKVHLYL